MRPRLPFALFALLSIATCGMFGACSNQSEGEPCNVNADDCASNLVCTQTPNNNGYRCCPAGKNSATTVICAANNPSISGGNPAPTEGGAAAVDSGSTSPDAAGPDASSRTDAAEGGPDAPADALDSAADSTSADSADGASE